jgi:thioesterase domain-containing protein
MDDLGRRFANLSPAQRAVVTARVQEQLREREHRKICSDSIVSLNTEGGRPPLYLVHPLSGSVACYFEISRHLDSHATFGIQARGLDGKFDPLSTIHGMAAAYVEAIREHHRAGPICLAGWSFGGFVAHEMAYILRCGTPSVAAVVQIDTNAAITPRRLLPTRLALLKEMYLTFDDRLPVDDAELAALTDDAQQEVLWSTLQWKGLLPPGFDLESFRGHCAVIAANYQALQEYRPSPADFDIVLLRATDVEGAEDTLGWSAVTTGTVTVHRVDGNHFDLVTATHALAVGRVLASCLPSIEALNVSR